MAKKKDPIQRAEEVGQQIFEVVSSGLADIVGRLQEITSTLDKKVEEQFQTFTGEPPPAPPKPAKSGKAVKAGKAGGSSPKKAKASPESKASKPKSKASGGSKSSGPTRDELYQQAQTLNIAGRSKMSKSQLAAAVKKAKA